jgi:hypothetical protein
MFSVEWAASAVDELAAIWTAAGSDERASITDATRQIDSVLRVDPELAGESRGGTRRVLLAPPLGIIFSVRAPDRAVRVLQVLRFRRRGGK